MKQVFDELPIEIQEVMLAEQVRQGGKKDPKVFRKDIGSGFTWEECEPLYEEDDILKEWPVDMSTFWYDILIKGNIEIFFNYYPRKTKYETINIGEDVFNI